MIALMKAPLNSSANQAHPFYPTVPATLAAFRDASL